MPGFCVLLRALAFLIPRLQSENCTSFPHLLVSQDNYGLQFLKLAGGLLALRNVHPLGLKMMHCKQDTEIFARIQEAERQVA